MDPFSVHTGVGIETSELVVHACRSAKNISVGSYMLALLCFSAWLPKTEQAYLAI